MSQDVRNRIRTFGESLLERHGGLVDWPDGAEEGAALLPSKVAEALDAPEEVILSYQPGERRLSLDLSSDFLDRAEGLLTASMRVGAFSLPEAYLKQAPMDEPVARTFTWHNARVKVAASSPTRVEYHTWYFLGRLDSDDRWEDVYCITINSQSGAEVSLPDLMASGEIRPNPQTAGDPADTYPQAARRAHRRLEERSRPFIARLESRLQRDRDRLRAYYNALLREAKAKLSRSKTGEEPKKYHDQKRAVAMELQRKLFELEERYTIRAELSPIALLRVNMPALAIECHVQRKQAHKRHTLYWNPILRSVEPMCCRACGAGTFSVAFTDVQVEPLCSACIPKRGPEGAH
jgi:hypothetical protein